MGGRWGCGTHSRGTPRTTVGSEPTPDCTCGDFPPRWRGLGSPLCRQEAGVCVGPSAVHSHQEAAGGNVFTTHAFTFGVPEAQPHWPQAWEGNAGFHLFHVVRGARTSAERHREAPTQPPTAPPSPWVSRDRDSPEEGMEARMTEDGAERGLCSPHLLHTVQTHSRSATVFYQWMNGWEGE